MTIRQLFHEKQIDAILLWNKSEIFWATGQTVKDSCLIVFPHRNVLITPEALDFGRGDMENRVYGEYGFESCENPVENIYQAIRQVLSGKTVIGITKNLKAMQVELQGLDLSLVDVSKEIETAMMCKPGRHIEQVRNSIRLNDEAFSEIRRTLKPGMTELEVRSIVQQSYERRAGRLLETNGDYLSGLRTTEIAGEPTAKKLMRGETLIVDIQVTDKGAAADTTRTFLLGKPSEEAAKAYQAVAQALLEMEHFLRPGLTGGEIYQKLSGMLRKAAGRELPHHAGHGVGYRWYEPPFLIPSETRKIQPGMILAIEPGIYQEHFGIRLENNFLITENGCENLCTCPLDMEWATVG